MRTTEQYLDLITPFFRGQPKFTETVALLTDIIAKMEAFVANNLPQCFDVDTAIGVQLDQTGQWIGRNRELTEPIYDAYFSFDTDGLGFDQAVWQGPYSPVEAIYFLDDETYRRLLYAKIAANNSDGTFETILSIYANFFSDPNTNLYIEDRQDMSYVVGLTGSIPNVLEQYLLTTEFVPLKPEGVRVYYEINSINNKAIFGFDLNNQFIQGFDQGTWGVTPPLSSTGVTPIVLTEDLSNIITTEDFYEIALEP
jgi:Protein of unknown function (DUF2612)